MAVFSPISEGSSPPPLCDQCDYDVRGLAKTGNCPECSAPVADAIKAAALHEAGKRRRRQTQLSFASAMSLAHVFVDALFCIGLYWVYEAHKPSQPRMTWGESSVFVFLTMASFFVLICGFLALRPNMREKWRIHGLDSQRITILWQLRIHSLLMAVFLGIAIWMDAKSKF